MPINVSHKQVNTKPVPGPKVVFLQTQVPTKNFRFSKILASENSAFPIVACPTAHTKQGAMMYQGLRSKIQPSWPSTPLLLQHDIRANFHFWPPKKASRCLFERYYASLHPAVTSLMAAFKLGTTVPLLGFGIIFLANRVIGWGAEECQLTKTTSGDSRKVSNLQ